MTRTMYDSTTAADVPADATMVAGYINGAYAWSDEDWARFPDAVKVRIAIYIPGRVPPNDGDVLDIEAGDAPAARAAAATWVAERIAAGAHPTIYTSRSALRSFAGLFCSFWVAEYTGLPHMVSVPGFDIVATQYAAPEYDSGGHYDLSLVVDGWPVGSSAPTPPAPPPAPVVINYPEDGVMHFTINVEGAVNGVQVSTDTNGWGSTILTGVPVERFEFAWPNGAGYVELPQFHSAQNEGGQCRINWKGPPLSPPFEAHIWVTE